MKKILISTIVDGNIGNRLQNYAMQKLFKDRGYDVKTMCFYPNNHIAKIKYYIRSVLYNSVPSLFDSIWRWDAFNFRYVKLGKNLEYYKNHPDTVDYYVVGSDQVWNPEWYSQERVDAFLLPFAQDAKKVAISASFGISSFSGEWRGTFSKELSRFKAISVREKDAVDIVEDLTGREAELVIDPTMMLSADDWRCIMAKPKIEGVKGKYILTYFLGGVTETAQNRIDELVKKYDFKVIDQAEYADLIGPGEFLYLLSHAQIVITDSFHGCVFSTIFKIPFLVYRRKNTVLDMFSRIDTLLNMLDLCDRHDDENKLQDVLQCDFSHTKNLIKKEQKKLNEFIDSALN